MNIGTIKAQLSRRLTARQKRLMKHCYYSLLYGNDLSRLAVACKTDKEGLHHYTRHYQRHFEFLRKKQLRVLEIGVGGYEDPRAGGESLRMWKAFFPNSLIYGIDIHDKTWHEEHRIKTYRGSQTDGDFLRRVAADIGLIDIIIDDGSHYNDHVISTFKILFPLMNSDGIYAVEDVQTSYWETAEGHSPGGSKDLAAPHTSMNFFKRLVDGLNYDEFMLEAYVPSYCPTLGGLKPSPSGDSFSPACGRILAWPTGMEHTASSRSICTSCG